MRQNAAAHPDAHLKDIITRQDVIASKPIATPLHLLDCCPISDGAAALIVSAEPGPVEISGAGQAHRPRHLSAMPPIFNTGTAQACRRAHDAANPTLYAV